MEMSLLIDGHVGRCVWRIHAEASILGVGRRMNRSFRWPFALVSSLVLSEEEEEQLCFVGRGKGNGGEGFRACIRKKPTDVAQHDA